MSVQVERREYTAGALNVHAIVYDNFAHNVEQHSSASLEDFLSCAFGTASMAFEETFGVTLDVTVVRHDTIRRILEAPPVPPEQVADMRRVYAEADTYSRYTYDMILYDLTVDRAPHLIFTMIGQDSPIRSRDLMKAVMFMGEGEAGTSAGRFCTARINTVKGVSYVIQHEISHSLGASHGPWNSIMSAGMMHGVATYPWDEKNKKIIRQKLEEIGVIRYE